MDPAVTLRQIGRVTLGSVGARGFTHSTNADGTGYVQFTISRGHRKVTVTLDASDTYSVRTFMKRSGRLVFEQTGVYAEQLAQAVWDAHLELDLNARLRDDPRYRKAA